MHRAFVVSGLIACSSGGKEPAVDELRVTKYLRDEMCRCKDSMCVMRVDASLASLDADKAKEPASADMEMMATISDLRSAYARCREGAMRTTPQPAPSPAPPAPPAEDLPPRATGAITVDRLWNDARTWARERRSQRILASASFDYVDAKGLLDPVDGEIRLVFGRVDDSEARRRIGAKVRPKQAYDDCFTLTNHDRWTESHVGCAETSAYNPRCSVLQIWERAIKQRVPAEAVAMLQLEIDNKNSALWTFTVEDEPRNIHIRETFPDDCPLAVEK